MLSHLPPSSTSSSSTPVDFAALQKTCAVVDVHLQGKQHTITCLQKRIKGVHPNLYASNCYLFAPNIIVYNSGQLCFSGGGYPGVAIYQVTAVWNASQDAQVAGNMWLRYYHPSGVTCTIAPFASKGFSSVTITQLDYGQSNGGTC